LPFREPFFAQMNEKSDQLDGDPMTEKYDRTQRDLFQTDELFVQDEHKTDAFQTDESFSIKDTINAN
jgi:hypothetical protein